MTAIPATPFSPEVRAFLETPRFAALATAGPDGQPHQCVTWYAVEPGGTILLNSRNGRHWPANLRRDPRLSLAIVDAADGRRWVGLAGEVVEIVDDVAVAREDIVALAHRYHPEGPDPAEIAGFRRQSRVSFRVRVTRVHDHLEA